MAKAVTIKVDGLGSLLSLKVNISEEIVEEIEFPVAGAVTDSPLPIGIDDITKVKAIVLITTQPVTFKVGTGESPKVVKLTSGMALLGENCTMLADSGAIDSLLFSNAGEVATTVKGVIIRSADLPA